MSTAFHPSRDETFVPAPPPTAPPATWAPVALIGMLFFFLIASFIAKSNPEAVRCLELGTSGRLGLTAIFQLSSTMFNRAFPLTFELYAAILSAFVVLSVAMLCPYRAVMPVALLTTAVCAIFICRHLEDLSVLAAANILFALLPRHRFLVPLILFVAPIVLGQMSGLLSPVSFSRDFSELSFLALSSPDFHQSRAAAVVVTVIVLFAALTSMRTSLCLAISTGGYLVSEQFSGLLCAAIGVALIELVAERHRLATESLGGLLHNPLRFAAKTGAIVSTFVGVAVGGVVIVGMMFVLKSNITDRTLIVEATSRKAFSPAGVYCSTRASGYRVISLNLFRRDGLSTEEYLRIVRGGDDAIAQLSKLDVSYAAAKESSALAHTLHSHESWEADTAKMAESYLWFSR